MNQVKKLASAVRSHFCDYANDELYKKSHTKRAAILTLGALLNFAMVVAIVFQVFNNENSYVTLGHCHSPCYIFHIFWRFLESGCMFIFQFDP